MRQVTCAIPIESLVSSAPAPGCQWGQQHPVLKATGSSPLPSSFFFGSGSLFPFSRPRLLGAELVLQTGRKGPLSSASAFGVPMASCSPLSGGTDPFSACSCHLSCLKAHLALLSLFLASQGSSVLFKGDKAVSDSVHFHLQRNPFPTPQQCPSSPSNGEHQVLSIDVPMQHSFSLSLEFCSVTHVFVGQGAGAVMSKSVVIINDPHEIQSIVEMDGMVITCY